jgi:hypothetical protein
MVRLVALEHRRVTSQRCFDTFVRNGHILELLESEARRNRNATIHWRLNPEQTPGS